MTYNPHTGEGRPYPFPILPWKKYDFPSVAEVETIEYDDEGKVKKRTIQRQIPALPYLVVH